jgi:hypothetical protein
MEPSAEDYGQHCWCIKTKLSQDGEILAYADEARVLPDGTLVLLRVRDSVHEINLSIAAGHWQAVYAAHLRDRSPFAIKQWAGQVDGGGIRRSTAKTKAKNPA